jgi:hypothetical protein
MSIWSVIIVSLIGLIAILILIETIMRQNKDRARISTLLAVLFQTKEYIRLVLDFHDHSKLIKRELPQINDGDLVKLYISLLRKSSVLANVTVLRAEKTFDYIKNISFANSAMSGEDIDLIEDLLNVKHGDDHDNYNIDLYDDRLNDIRKIIKDETNKAAIDNVL